MESQEKVVQEEEQQILLEPKADRRLLPNAPDTRGIRTNRERRGISNNEQFKDVQYSHQLSQASQRYQACYDVTLRCKMKEGKVKEIQCKSKDISVTGILLQMENEQHIELIHAAKSIQLKFTILPGTMPEGFESKVSCSGKVVRIINDELLCGIEFTEPLNEQLRKRKDRYLLAMSSLLLLCISVFVLFLRAESIIYFQFNKTLYLYSIVAAVFLLSRYLFGLLYSADEVDPEFTPGVTVIIPCFNEEEWIDRTIISCMNQDYPIEKLQVIVVDDCSNDRSVEVIQQTIERIHRECEGFNTRERLTYFVQPENKGKRDALAIGSEMAKHELVVFVDSDSFLDPFAIRNLVQPFKDQKVGGVTGRTDVANTYTNWLTKMQSVRYYIAFRIMKAAESYFDSVTCLSGPLSCYRKDLVFTYMEPWLNQKFLGRPATFGDDRSLTNFILRSHRTVYQDTAICSTIVPHKSKVFLKQQMRWKRSWLRESIIAASFIWKKEPFMALFFYIGLVVPIISPVIVLYNLVYVPMVHRIFPMTFIVGFLLMAFLMSFAQMFFKRSSIWIYGFFFCLYYLTVLIWQMPIAWFTFWKSTWGTRMTPQDIEAEQKRKNRQKKRQKKIQDEEVVKA